PKRRPNPHAARHHIDNRLINHYGGFMPPCAGTRELMGRDDAALRHGRLARLVNEQAALRRIATLVARAMSPAEVFTAVAEEVHRLLKADITTLHRFDPDGSFTLLAGVGTEAQVIGVGDRWDPAGAPGLVEIVGGRSIRVDDYRPVGGALDEIVRADG